MFSPSDYNDAVPQFSNGNYANEPLSPLYVEEPDDINYKRGAEPLQTLPVQWWNWLWNKITAKLNNLNIYVKNIFNELAALLSLVNVTPDATKEEVTTEQLKDMFATKYPQYLNDSDIFKTKYPQYLNDNFKFESLLQGRTRGVIVTPTDTWNNNTNTLSLTGGFGIINTYHKVTFSDCNLVIPNDTSVHFIVSDTSGVISIQDSIKDNVILIGLCRTKEYCLLIDNNPDQCKNNIILKKWFGQHNISKDFVPVLQSYYNTYINYIETEISIPIAIDSICINDGFFDNCTINIRPSKVVSGGTYISNSILRNCTIIIDTVSNGGYGIINSTLNNCTINIKTVNSGTGISNGTFNTCIITFKTAKSYNYFIYKGTYYNCTINIGTVSGSFAISDSTLNNCTINIGTVSGGTSISNGTLNNCTITIETVSGGMCIDNGTFNTCTITIKTVNRGTGISKGTFNACTITIETVSGGSGIIDYTGVFLYLTYINCLAITSLSNTAGKLNVLNDTVFHAS